MRRVVIDSNVLISARLSPRGAPGRLLAAWLAGRFELIVSPALLAEMAGVPCATEVPSLAERRGSSRVRAGTAC